MILYHDTRLFTLAAYGSLQALELALAVHLSVSRTPLRGSAQQHVRCVSQSKGRSTSVLLLPVLRPVLRNCDADCKELALYAASNRNFHSLSVEAAHM